MYYFAYGSNMLMQRMRERVPSAKSLGIARLRGHSLAFQKTGDDGSGKCDVFPTGNPNDEVFGVLYQIDDGERASLDAFETGYARIEVSVDAIGGSFRPITYMARETKRNPAMTPFSWYRNLVYWGGWQQGLPSSYLSSIHEVPVRRDADEKRHGRANAILERAGFCPAFVDGI